MKQTAVEWLLENMPDLSKNIEMGLTLELHAKFQHAKEIEKEQRGYSEEDVIKIVEKSRETGLTAEYLLLTFKSE